MIWFSYLLFSIPRFHPTVHATHISVRYRLIEYPCCTRYPHFTMHRTGLLLTFLHMFDIDLILFVPVFSLVPQDH